MLNTILFIVSAICFLFAMLSVSLGEIDLVILGFFFLALGHIPFGTLVVRA